MTSRPRASWTWRRRGSAAFFGIFAAGMLVIGAGELADGYLPQGLTALAVAVLAVVIEVLTWVNWRLLEMNQDLIETNKGLADLNERLLGVQRTRGERWN